MKSHKHVHVKSHKRVHVYLLCVSNKRPSSNRFHHWQEGLANESHYDRTGSLSIGIMEKHCHFDVSRWLWLAGCLSVK